MTESDLNRYRERVDAVRLNTAFRKLHSASLRAQAIAYIERLAEEEVAQEPAKSCKPAKG